MSIIDLSPIYFKREDETYEEWSYRLITAKVDKEIDLDWIDIRDLLELDCSHETLRKEGQGVAKVYKYFCQQRTKEATDSIDGLDDKLNTMQRERIRLQTIALHNNRVIREDERKNMLFDEFIRAVRENSIEPPKFNTLPISTSNKGALLGFGDVHFGKIFESVNNEYNEDVVKERLSDLLTQTIHKVKQENLSHIHIVNGADNVDGIGLRISQLMSLQFGLMDQVIRYQRLLVEWLNQLSAHVKITYHHVPSSNHTEIRPLGTKAGQFPKEDIERLIATYIHDMLRHNTRIEMPLYQDDFARFDICGYKFYAKHGHQIKNVKTALRDLSMLHREFIDYLILSHFHHAEEITVGEGKTNDCEVIILPSVMGSDKFSDRLMTGAKAAAKLLIFEEGKGKVTSHTLKLN